MGVDGLKSNDLLQSSTTNIALRTLTVATRPAGQAAFGYFDDAAAFGAFGAEA